MLLSAACLAFSTRRSLSAPLAHAQSAAQLPPPPSTLLRSAAMCRGEGVGSRQAILHSANPRTVGPGRPNAPLTMLLLLLRRSWRDAAWFFHRIYIILICSLPGSFAFDGHAFASQPLLAYGMYGVLFDVIGHRVRHGGCAGCCCE